MNEFTIEIRPMFDELGYQSEAYATVTIRFNDVWYEFSHIILIESESGLDVWQNASDYELLHPDNAEYVGRIRCPKSGPLHDLAVVSWFLTSLDAESVPCEVC